MSNASNIKSDILIIINELNSQITTFHDWVVSLEVLFSNGYLYTDYNASHEFPLNDFFVNTNLLNDLEKKIEDYLFLEDNTETKIEKIQFIEKNISWFNEIVNDFGHERVIINIKDVYTKEVWDKVKNSRINSFRFKVNFDKLTNEIIWNSLLNNLKNLQKSITDLKENLGIKIIMDDTNISIQTASEKIDKKQLEYLNYNMFLEALKQLDQNNISVFQYKAILDVNLLSLKSEIFENILMLEKDDRILYLNKIKFRLDNVIKGMFTLKECLNLCEEAYNFVTVEEISSREDNQELYSILTSVPRSDGKEPFTGIQPDPFLVQIAFSDLFHNFYLEEALNFINDQIKDLKSQNYLQNDFQIPSVATKIANPKLKTNLSVPQLALLFKMLNDLKPNIFEVKSEAELHRFISANFETKRSNEEGISIDKLRILFNQPDPKAADFWEKNFYTLVSKVKDFK